MHVRMCVNVSVYKYLYCSKSRWDRTWKGPGGDSEIGRPKGGVVGPWTSSVVQKRMSRPGLSWPEASLQWDRSGLLPIETASKKMALDGDTQTMGNVPIPEGLV